MEAHTGDTQHEFLQQTGQELSAKRSVDSNNIMQAIFADQTDTATQAAINCYLNKATAHSKDSHLSNLMSEMKKPSPKRRLLTWEQVATIAGAPITSRIKE